MVMGDMNIDNQKEGKELDEKNVYSFRLNTAAKVTNHPLAKTKRPYDDAMVIDDINPYGQKRNTKENLKSQESLLDFVAIQQ